MATAPSIDTLASNAWCGQAASGPLAEGSLGWAMGRDLPRPGQGMAPEVVDLDDWRQEKVGWGVVLPEREVFPPADKAAGADAPAPIRELMAERGHAPVLRWAPELKEGRLRRYASKADPRDVLQEVFFNIYRYPHRFNAERDDAFRVWSAMIVRNTVLKHLRAQGHGGRAEIAIEDLSGEPEVAARSPLHSAVEHESRKECERVYLTYLHLYLRFYSMLSERERKALQLVEVEERSYRVAAEVLGIKLENLKMVIFRARRKIHRSMRRVFDGLSPDCRPAREPRVSEGVADASRMGDEDESDRQEVDER